MLKSYKDKSKNKPYIIVEISDKIMVNIMKKVRQILNIDSLHKNNIMGENVTVAVLDTGIYNHPDFGERIIKYKDFVNGKTAIYDDEGHGTHVTGILAGDGKMSNGFYQYDFLCLTKNALLYNNIEDTNLFVLLTSIMCAYF